MSVGDGISSCEDGPHWAQRRTFGCRFRPEEKPVPGEETITPGVTQKDLTQTWIGNFGTNGRERYPRDSGLGQLKTRTHVNQYREWSNTFLRISEATPLRRSSLRTPRNLLPTPGALPLSDCTRTLLLPTSRGVSIVPTKGLSPLLASRDTAPTLLLVEGIVVDGEGGPPTSTAHVSPGVAPGRRGGPPLGVDPWGGPSTTVGPVVLSDPLRSPPKKNPRYRRTSKQIGR